VGEQHQHQLAYLDEDLLTVKECAARLPVVSEPTLRRMIVSGQVHTVRVGSGRGRPLIPESEVLRLMQRWPIATLRSAQPAESSTLYAETMAIMDLWRQTRGTSDLVAIAQWMARETARFRRAFPDLALEVTRAGFGAPMQMPY